MKAMPSLLSLVKKLRKIVSALCSKLPIFQSKTPKAGEYVLTWAELDRDLKLEKRRMSPQLFSDLYLGKWLPPEQTQPPLLDRRGRVIPIRRPPADSPEFTMPFPGNNWPDVHIEPSFHIDGGGGVHLDSYSLVPGPGGTQSFLEIDGAEIPIKMANYDNILILDDPYAEKEMTAEQKQAYQDMMTSWVDRWKGGEGRCQPNFVLRDRCSDDTTPRKLSNNRDAEPKA